MNLRRNIYLIGMPGSGKSTVGKALAHTLQLPFYDLDEMIVKGRGQSIPEIFAQEGEQGFRTAERNTLRETAGLAPAVIAAGGGTPCFFDNMAWMNENGHTVFLRTSIAVLIKRLAAEAGNRPLFTGLTGEKLSEKTELMLKERTTWYEKAEWAISSDKKTEATVREIIERLKSKVA